MNAAPIVRRLAQTVTQIFYRVDQAGQAPASGAVLLLPNHPNSLLDPAVVWATAGRDVRFLAKSTLFSTPLGPLLRAAGAIPIYRRHDQGVDTSRNAEMFEAVERALADDEAICIFPEGMSHSTGRLETLRTGAARMTIGAERRGIAVQLVPVGLNFDRKTAFRSRVTVLYGQAFSARDLAQDERDGVTLLTERIAGQMRRLLVEADPRTDAAIVKRVERLYSAARGKPRSPAERIARGRAIATGIEKLRESDGARYADIAMRLRRYDQRLRRFGLRDSQLDWDVSTRGAMAFILREGLAAIVLVPVALAGLTIFWVPQRLTGWIARRATSERDIAATAKVFAGAAVYAAWIVLIVTDLWWSFGTVAGLSTAAAVPLLAIAGLFAIEREVSAVETARSWLVLRRAKGQSRRSLKHARSDLAELLEQTYEWLNTETRAPAAAHEPR
jgi:1-acyl-sn-glycerol-3-phosphate acyltransferase